ncbi:MAG: GyrI-like domain-containing protein [Chitinophagaceae bacterium]|nr:GyrI-like domain-containing protein [Chitinophagaceae bacterium]
MKKIVLLLPVVLLALASCNNNTEEKKTAPEVKADTSTPAETTKAAREQTKRPPIINITDTLSEKKLVLYMKDSAATVERIGLKLATVLGFKLDAVIKKNKLSVTGRPMAWYNSTKAPFFFEAGIPVDKRPTKQPSNVYIREIGVDSVTVAHFYGNYDQLSQAYEALNDWLKNHKKTLRGKPYEIYVDDPSDKDGKMKDPYKVQTDVVFPWK